jgi:hypothetical protein
MIGIGVANAVVAANGVKTVAKKRTEGLANLEAKKKATGLLNSTLKAGANIVGSIREDIDIVVGAAKTQQCAARCEHCAVKDTYKPCCKDGEACKVKNAENESETPEPVKAADVIAQHEEADAVAEVIKNEEVKGEKLAAAEVKKKAAAKARTPRAAKEAAKPVSVKEALRTNPEGLIVGEIRDVETTVTPKDVAEQAEKTEKED